jgi:hypothetical protein
MAIEQANTYEIGVNNDLTNALAMIDANRVGIDLVSVEYSAPNFLIKVGSLIEANGSLWKVTGSDVSLTAADGNLVFDDSVPEFKIDNTNTPVYDPAKGGYYVNGTERVSKWELTSTGGILTEAKRSLIQQGSSFEVEKSIGFDSHFSMGMAWTPIVYSFTWTLGASSSGTYNVPITDAGIIYAAVPFNETTNDGNLTFDAKYQIIMPTFTPVSSTTVGKKDYTESLTVANSRDGFGTNGDFPDGDYTDVNDSMLFSTGSNCRIRITVTTSAALSGTSTEKLQVWFMALKR